MLETDEKNIGQRNELKGNTEKEDSDENEEAEEKPSASMKKHVY